jgi:hypothetical protein
MIFSPWSLRPCSVEWWSGIQRQRPPARRRHACLRDRPVAISEEHQTELTDNCIEAVGRERQGLGRRLVPIDLGRYPMGNHHLGPPAEQRRHEHRLIGLSFIDQVLRDWGHHLRLIVLSPESRFLRRIGRRHVAEGPKTEVEGSADMVTVTPAKTPCRAGGHGRDLAA